MRNYLVAVLAGAALVSCNQRPAPTSAETAAAPTAASGAPGETSGATATTDTASAAAVADAPPAAPCAGDGCPKPASGYDWAAAHGITDAKDCTEGDQAFKDGCALYVHEKDVEEGEKSFESDSQ